MIRPVGCPALILFIVLAGIVGVAAQQPDSSGAFVLHKFARAIGKETYSIDAEGDQYTLTSHFTFTDRGTGTCCCWMAIRSRTSTTRGGCGGR
jgi:hypothetical protein